MLLDESSAPMIEVVVRHAVQSHNNVTSVKSTSAVYFKLDKYERTVDASNSFHVSQASMSRHHVNVILYSRQVALLTCVHGSLRSFTQTLHHLCT